MRVAIKLALTGIIAWGRWHPALAAWSGFDQPADGICTFGSPLRDRHAALVITGRFEMGSGRANAEYSLVFTADDRTPEVTQLDLAVDEQNIARFDVVSHVPSAPGASAVVTLNTDKLGTLFHATDSGQVLRVSVTSVPTPYDFDLTGFAAAADTFASCMLRNTQ